METSQTIAWKCGYFFICISNNSIYREYEEYIKDPNIIHPCLESTELNKVQASFTPVHLRVETWGLRGRE